MKLEKINLKWWFFTEKVLENHIITAKIPYSNRLIVFHRL